MPDAASLTPGAAPVPTAVPTLRGPFGRRLRLAHLTTVDMSLALLLETELRVDVESGFEVFAISAPGPYVPRVEAAGVTHVPVPALTRAWDLARDLRAARELGTVLRRLRLDVLHTHNPKTGVLGRVLGRVLGIPVVVNTCHGLWLHPDDGFLRTALVLSAEAVAAQASHAELYQNADDRNTLQHMVPRLRSRVVGNGVDLDRFRPDPAGAAAIRRELGIEPDGLLVGGVGRLVAEKGIREYAAAARRLAGKARFVWIGPADADKPDGISAAELRAAGPWVEFLPPRTGMPAVYTALDVFVLPSHREGLSRSAMEAAACGTAMVLSDIRGCREIGRHEEHLLFVAAGDEEALSEAVGRLLADADLRARLGRAAQVRACDCFDQRAVASQSLRAYAAVARRRRLAWRHDREGSAR